MTIDVGSSEARSSLKHRSRTVEREAEPLRERELTALWLLGRVPPELLPTGWTLLRPGRAGRGAGPDVREATFRGSSGAVIAGDVEVHLRASDFARHGHADDPNYAGVRLHLVWVDDRLLPDAPLALPGGGEAPTLAVAPVLGGDPARLRRLVTRGPTGGEPCREFATDATAEALRDALRGQGQRRLAERVWAAAHLVESHGWDGAWRQLLTRALRGSAGRRAGREDTATLAAALTSQLATTPTTTATASALRSALLPSLRMLALESRPGPLIEALRGPEAAPLVGRARAAELGWNAALPLLAAAATAYDDPPLARATASLAERWPAPRPYGSTTALRAQLLAETSALGGGALAAQGLLHVQDIWCSRGGCGVCPLSP
jgi:hypothetical protein